MMYCEGCDYSVCWLCHTQDSELARLADMYGQKKGKEKPGLVREQPRGAIERRAPVPIGNRFYIPASSAFDWMKKEKGRDD